MGCLEWKGLCLTLLKANLLTLLPRLMCFQKRVPAGFHVTYFEQQQQQQKPRSNLTESDGSFFFSAPLHDKLYNPHFIGEKHHFFC